MAAELGDGSTSTPSGARGDAAPTLIDGGHAADPERVGQLSVDAAAVDQIRLSFDGGRVAALNLVIAALMFGMALDLRVNDFRLLWSAPRAPLVGLLAQCVLLPFFSFVLTLLLRPAPSIALGMLLVAACPGGNVSNLITYLARGNVALSVSMSAGSTALALLTTPMNFALWGGLNPATAPLLREVRLEPLDLFRTVALILALPLAAGLALAHFCPALVRHVRGFFKATSLVLLAALIASALAANWATFVRVIGWIAAAVALHNGLALLVGYATARAFRLPARDVRAVTIEVGIQNAGLALVLVVDFFDGLGGMAVIAAWWSVWHMISGLALASLWARQPPA